MDAVEFLNKWARMCQENFHDCMDCPACTLCHTSSNRPEELVCMVKEWDKKKHKKTRQDEFLEHYPNAKLNDAGRIKLCPLTVDKNYNLCDLVHDCFACKDYYWSQEIE